MRDLTGDALAAGDLAENGPRERGPYHSDGDKPPYPRRNAVIFGTTSALASAST